MIRVAVIGAGHWGPNLIGNFHDHRRSEVAWVIDRSEPRLEAVRARFPEVRTGSDANEVFRDPEVEAVVIATPTSTHFELTKAALEAGKHVLVEKPLADSVEHAVALDELARDVGRILMVGHIFVYNSAAQAAKKYITNGDLGRVYYLSMVRTNLGPIRVDVNAAWDLAAHDISLATYWLDAEPLTVSAVGGSWINPGIEDAVFATLRYPGEVLVNLHASWLHPRKSRDITVVGDKKMLIFDDVHMSEPLRIFDKQVADESISVPFVDDFSSFRMSVQEGDILTPRVAMSQPLGNECAHFLDCVENGEKPLSGGAEGISVVRTLEAISESLRVHGREVVLES
jgi:predicted dehydrogenase